MANQLKIELVMNDSQDKKDLPAIQYKNGDSYWFEDGKLHRLNGPAIEKINGNKQWFIDGTEYSEEEFNKRLDK